MGEVTLVSAQNWPVVLNLEEGCPPYQGGLGLVCKECWAQQDLSTKHPGLESLGLRQKVAK